jgi:Predicted DNA alkylation repair enzyme
LQQKSGMDVFDSRKALTLLAENDYRKFSQALTPNVSNVLGVRVPHVRDMAKDIVKTDWIAWLQESPCDYLEEKSLRGFVICYAKIPLTEKLALLKAFIPIIDNWATCDTVVSSLKLKKGEKPIVWDFIQPYFSSDEEFEIRFAVVMSLAKFIDEDHIDALLEIYNGIKHGGYYVKMAVAWALSVCYVKFPDKTILFFKSNSLDDFTHNKAIQKCMESFRVSKEQKSLLKFLKKLQLFWTNNISLQEIVNLHTIYFNS